MPWTPEPAAEYARLKKRQVETLEEMTEAEFDALGASARSILAQCVAPNGPVTQNVGLVVGEVQSGKTLSFTAVTALARDNGFPLIVVLGGSKTNLVDQSFDRLREDLDADGRHWRVFKNPVAGDLTKVTQALNEWDDATTDAVRRQGVVFVVMKNSTHMNAATKLIADSNASRFPILIIDDEADQASPNSQVNSGGASTIHRLLTEMKAVAKKSTLLQYTATPQAPLLASVISAMSPDFCHVLVPGAAYTGGRTFFVDRPELVTEIPAQDTPTSQNAVTAAPPSLLRAMQEFMLGAALGISQGAHDSRKKNRSMLIHPSGRVRPHAKYKRWAAQTIQTWIDALTGPDGQAKTQLLADFGQARQTLLDNGADLPALNDLLPHLVYALRHTEVTEINNESGATIQWESAYSHIVVGGNAVDRGFTVRGLTVTYMPRAMGTGAVDTILQRARFYGYKASYLDLCRVYLETDVLAAFKAIIEHEEDVRASLQEHIESGASLKEWRRKFLLDPDLSATRRQVYDLRLYRGDFKNWLIDKSPHLADLAGNREATKDFLEQVDPQPVDGDARRTPLQKHSHTRIRLRDVYNNLLTKFDMSVGRDAGDYTVLLVHIEKVLEDDGDQDCDVYDMSQGKTRERAAEADVIKSLFAGPSELGDIVYPGDAELKSAERVTVQIHHLRVTRDGLPAINDVPALAIHVGGQLDAGFAVQELPED